MKESSIHKDSFPYRTNSAPPDEGEIHLKLPMMYNLGAPEFKPFSPAVNKKTSLEKKQLNASAASYEPSKPLPALKLNDGAEEFVPGFAVKPPAVAEKTIKLQDFKAPEFISDTKIENSGFTNEKTSPVDNDQEKNIATLQTPLVNTQILHENNNLVETSNIKPEVEPEVLNSPEPAETIPAEEIKRENDTEPSEPSVYKKKCYDFEKIKTFKLDFSKDPNFIVVPKEILMIKERKVEVIKTGKLKRGEDKKKIREDVVIGQVHWRKAKTAEEEKISNKAKEYREKLTVPIQEQEKIKKQIRATLNKLSPNNLDKLSQEILETCKKSHDYLKLVALGIFEKAWSENKYTQMYSELCKFLKNGFEKFSYNPDPSVPPKNLFKYELLYMCEETFEYNAAESDLTNLSEEEIASKKDKIKKKTLGNARFIGELFNVNLITAKIILGCINSLLNSFVQENNEDKLEGACVLLLTGGSSFERAKLKPDTDDIYNRLDKILQSSNISSKNSFKILDLKEHRMSGWKINNKKELKKIEEIHAEFKFEQDQILKRHGYS